MGILSSSNIQTIKSKLNRHINALKREKTALIAKTSLDESENEKSLMHTEFLNRRARVLHMNEIAKMLETDKWRRKKLLESNLDITVSQCRSESDETFQI